MIQLGDLIHPELVHLNVEVGTKDELLDRLLDHLVDAGWVEDRGSVLEALLERERVMSTGIGRGVAIPHAQSSGARKLSVSVARPVRPLEFGAIDDQPVRLVFLVTGPEERGGFIRVLARISRLLCSGDLQERILAATDSETVLASVREAEAALG